MSAVFSPLDSELGLLPGELTPTLYRHVCRLATCLPFSQAGQLLEQLLGVQASEASVRRWTERIGAAALAASEAEQQRLETEAPPPPQGPEKLVVSTDGAMVPLLKGEWAEVKTLAVGRVSEPVAGADGEERYPTTELSYFSRLLPIEEFQTAVYPELYRRGLETAEKVAAVNDGADWCQTFIEFYRRDARRILDFPHAAERVTEIARLCLGEGDRASEWSREQLASLRRHGPRPFLERLEELASGHPDKEKVAENLEYLRKREGQIDYPAHIEAGWPIGSGCVESANKLVVEARLKGAGMHWARRHVNPMLALRNGHCNQQWNEVWTQACRQLGRKGRPMRKATATPAPDVGARELPGGQGAGSALEVTTATEQPPRVRTEATPVPAPAPPHPASRKPAPNHPWRQRNPGWLSRG